jgi:hypothetical protein
MEKANKTDVRYVDAASKYKENVLPYTFQFSTYRDLSDPRTGST